MKNILQFAKPPNYLISFTLLLWGYQSELLIWAILMAFILEIQTWISWRLHLDDKDFYKIGNFCTLIFTITIAIAILGSKQQLVIHQIINLLPIVFYPLLLSEYYSNSKIIPLGAFIYRYRKNDAQVKIKLGYLYLAISLLAASVINTDPNLFFLMLILIIFWALWHIKSPSVNVFKWFGILVLVSSVSYVGQQSLVRTALSFEQWATDYFNELFNGDRDPFRSRTAMGRIGELKLSNKIVMRVRSKSDKPVLLQEAIYDSFYNNVWFSSLRKFTTIQKKVIKKNDHTKIAQMIIHRTTRNNRSLLALPSSLVDISVASYINLARNQFGTTKATDTDKLFEYSIYNAISRTTNIKSVPTAGDLIIPKPYRKIISEINSELKLKTDNNVINTISDYFKDKYRYSLFQEKQNYNQLPLETFLRSKHRGHCEFFASATVLLLRSAGIPTRYVVGYSATEYDKNDALFIVRARDSHAWAQAYVNNKWLNVDNTPGIWYQEEAIKASLFEPLTDLFSNLNYKYSLWRRDSNLNDYQIYIIISGVVVLLILFLKNKGSRSWFISYINDKNKTKQSENDTYHELLQQVFQVAHQYGISKHTHEPLLHWQQRYEQFTNDKNSSATLKKIILQYYKLRFATGKTTEKDIEKFKGNVDLWLADISHSTQK